MQTDQRQQFINFPRSEKIAFITTFYGGMIKKTDNPEYIARFQSKIDEVLGYEENEGNTKKLISLYDRIISANEKTKAREMQEEHEKMQQSMERIKKLQQNNFDEDADQFLAEQMSQI